MAEHLRAGADESVILGRCGSLLCMQQLVDVFENRVGGFGPSQQYDDPATFRRHVAHCSAVGPAGRTVCIQTGAQKIPKCVHRLDPDRHGAGCGQVAKTQRKVQSAIDKIPIGMQDKTPPLGVNGLSTVKFDRLLMERAVLDEVGNGAHVELMLLGKDL